MAKNYQPPTVEDDPEDGLLTTITKAFISKEDFERMISLILPLPGSCNISKTIFRDTQFIRIAELLQLFGKTEWSLRPRTFAILRMLGCTDAMDGFVSEHRSDLYLPYTEMNLPKAIKGASLRSKFIRLQTLVFSQQSSADVERGTHVHFNCVADEYFCRLRGFGVGRFGEVDEVYSNLSWNHYARKRILRGGSSMNDKTMLESFENDLAALKALSHHHIVSLVGSYTDLTCVGLIMSPVADMNLWEYMDSPIDRK